MQQLSRPYQIALGALLVFALAWFAVLKPSDPADAAPAPPPAPVAATPAVPGAAGLGNAVGAAKDAAAAATARPAAAQAAGAAVPGTPVASAAPGPDATPAGVVAEKPAVAPADPSKAILRDVARGKVVVLLFFSRQGAEDRAVRRALRRADRHRGRVVVRAASIDRVAEYAAITEGVDVLQAPTLLVIGRDNRARALVGYADTKSIDQLVSDVGGRALRKRR